MIIYIGMLVGILLIVEDKIIFYVGDMVFFFDMKFIGELNYIDIVFLLIGDNFMMGFEDVKFVVEWLCVK